MVDVSTMIAAKSDQLNADDLLAGPLTITVSDVKATGDKEQPLSIFYKGDGGKPYKPGKSMRRVLVMLWGAEGAAYIGRSMTLYRDPEVTFGKLKVGGIRITHMTDIGVDQILALAVTKGAKRAYEVKPLRLNAPGEAPADTIEDARGWIRDANTIEELVVAWKTRRMAPFRAELQDVLDARKAELTKAAPDASDNQEDDEEGDDAPDPRRSLVDGFVERCKAAADLGAVNAIDGEFTKHRAAMPDELAAEVDDAVDAAKARIKAADAADDTFPGDA